MINVKSAVTSVVNSIVPKATMTVNRAGLKVSKYSPELMLGLGIIGGVVSAVMACQATTKASKILEETSEDIEKVHICQNDPSMADDYTKKDATRDLTLIYTQTGVKLLRLYGPSLIVGGLSIASVIGSHHIMKKRNVAIAGAYAAVSEGYKNYRQNVINKFGEEVDKEMRYNIKAKDITEKITTDSGIEGTKTESKKVSDGVLCSPYAKFFDESSREWTKNADYNLMFLQSQQQWANDRLRTRGHLFLNEVYDALDIPRTKDGQYIGWIYDRDHKRISDCANYVDFGIYNIDRESSRDFVNGYERSILLDFNVDGNIIDYI